jgi:hypothetical protein
LEAVKENADCAVVFNAVGKKYQVISGGADKDYYTAGDNVILREVDFLLYDANGNIGYGHTATCSEIEPSRGFGNDITFDDANAGTPADDDTIVFNSRGTIHTQADSAGEVYLVNSRNTSYAVGVTAIGGIFLRRCNASSGSYE